VPGLFGAECWILEMKGVRHHPVSNVRIGKLVVIDVVVVSSVW